MSATILALLVLLVIVIILVRVTGSSERGCFWVALILFVGFGVAALIIL